MNGWDFLRLIFILRQVPLPITSEDLSNAYYCIQHFQELPTKKVLRAILIHRPEDLLVFDLVWESLFVSRNYRDELLSQGLLKGPDFKEDSGTDGFGGLGLGSGYGGTSLNQKGHPSLPSSKNYEQIFLKNGYDARDFEQAINTLLAEADYFGWINSVELAFKREQLTEEEFALAKQQAEGFKRILRRDLLSWQLQFENSWAPLSRQYWRFKPLQTLSKEEANLVQKALRHWAKKLAIRPGWRKRSSNSGELNLGRAAKEYVQGDGYIFHLHYRKRLPRIPELVVLCDVSNSVAPYVEFLIFLLDQIKSRIRRVRLFLFIDILWEVSNETWEDQSEIQEKIATWSRKASSGFSDYGQVLKEFASNILPEVSARSTIIILGDGKNNYRSPQVEYLREIKDKVKRVYWLNPLEEQEWHERDSIIACYKPFCSGIFRCRTADDLREITGKIF